MTDRTLENLQEAYMRLHEDYVCVEEINQSLRSQIREIKIQLWRSELETEALRSRLLESEKEQRG